jgi:LemA protein
MFGALANSLDSNRITQIKRIYFIMGIYIIGFLITLLILFLIVIAVIYNSLVSARAFVQEGWSGVDVQLKRRYDLIPQLIESVRANINLEQKTFTEIADIRSKSMQATNLNEKSILEKQLSGKINDISVIVENYPELKTSETIKKLMNQLFEIEEQIQLARRYYNGTVREYNIKLQSFPTLIFVKLFGHKSAEFFEADENAREDVKVNL